VRLIGLTNMALSGIYHKKGQSKQAKAAADEARKCFETLGSKHKLEKLEQF
jgi:hypothetical protein